MTDNVNHPAHYKVGGIETIDFIEAKKLNYNLGNVVKYITRADHKSNRLEDLRKAAWYLQREIGSQPAPVVVKLLPPVVTKPVVTKPVVAEPVVVSRKRRSRRYPYNPMIEFNNRPPRNLRSNTKLYNTYTLVCNLLASGPARRLDITDTLSEINPHASKHISMLLDYKLLKVVS